MAMDDVREKCDWNREELQEFAKSVGAWYYDPGSPVVWKRYIIGPVPLWRRILWWFFPPSDIKMQRITERRRAKFWAGVSFDPKTPTARETARVTFLAVALPVLLSGVGPLYYGYNGSPYIRVLVWAGVCTLGYLSLSGSGFKVALSTANPSLFGRLFAVLSSSVLVGLIFVTGDSLIYLIARTLGE
jgi:hypothetical protein